MSLLYEGLPKNGGTLRPTLRHTRCVCIVRVSVCLYQYSTTVLRMADGKEKHLLVNFSNTICF